MQGFAHKKKCTCRFCQRIQTCRSKGKKRSMTFQAFPDLVEKILRKSGQAGVSPGKWVEDFLNQAP